MNIQPMLSASDQKDIMLVLQTATEHGILQPSMTSTHWGEIDRYDYYIPGICPDRDGSSLDFGLDNTSTCRLVQMTLLTIRVADYAISIASMHASRAHHCTLYSSGRLVVQSPWLRPTMKQTTQYAYKCILRLRVYTCLANLGMYMIRVSSTLRNRCEVGLAFAAVGPPSTGWSCPAMPCQPNWAKLDIILRRRGPL